MTASVAMRGELAGDADVVKRLQFDALLATPAPRLPAGSALPSPAPSSGTPLTAGLKQHHQGHVSQSGTRARQAASGASSDGFVRYGLPVDELAQLKVRPEVVYRAPSGYDPRYMGEDSEDEGEGEERDDRLRDTASSAAAVDLEVTRPTPVEQMLQQVEHGLWRLLKVSQEERTNRWQQAFMDADAQLGQQLAHIEQNVSQKAAEMREADERSRAAHQQERDQRLRELQRSHEKAAAIQQAQVEKVQQKAEAERRAAEELARKKAAEEAARLRAEKEAEERRREEEARKRAEEQAKEAQEQQQKQQQEQASQAAAEAAKAKTAPAAISKDQHPALRVSPDAARSAAQLESRLAELRASVAALEADEGAKKERRDVEKKMTVHVQQISATLDQVTKKCRDVYGMLMARPDPVWRTYAMLTLATKVVRQYELIQLNPKAAFPLAAVVVNVSTQFPELMEIMVATLQAECCLVIPRAYAHDAKLITPKQYAWRMGFKELEDPDKPGAKVFESLDAFMQRVEGVMLLYGAIVQVDIPANPHGLDHGWRWLARLLNCVPPDRVVMKALYSFLRMAGYALNRRFRGQYVKLLRCMHDEYLPQLAGVPDASETQATRTQLEHYLKRGEYAKEPDGSKMPNMDMSSSLDMRA